MTLRKIVIFLLTAPLVAGAIALGLVVSQKPDADLVGSGAAAVMGR